MGREPESIPTAAAAAAADGVARGADGPPAADGWVLATLPRALAFAAGLLKDRQQAEDVVHDCYCRLLARADVYDLPRDGAKLLFRSITNACVDARRRRPTLSLYAADDDDADAPGRMRELADRRAQEPWQLADHDDLRRAVTAGLERLPVAQRAAVELRSLGHSLEEIAAALNVTPSNAGVLVHRGRQALARHVAGHVEA